jgi:NCS1 family nucleobase:cation symporter-1
MTHETNDTDSMAHDAVSVTMEDPDVSVHGPETRGIEYITEDKRGGRPSSLFWVWATPNISFLTITLGAVLVAGLGLSLWQALAVTVIANLGWILVGILAVSGPAAGTSGSVITRAMYGIRGNKIIVGLYGWLLSAVYLSLTWSAASVNGIGLLTRFGVPSNTAVDVTVVVLIAGVTALVGIYGHGLITRLYPYVANGLAVIFLLATAFMVPRFDLSYQPSEPLSGAALAAAMTVGVTILASAPLSFFNSPDMARYLPTSTPKWKTAAATGCGGATAGIIFTMVGALIATGAGFDMIGDPLGAFETAMPTWFFPVFTLGVIVAAIGLNGMTTYSASLSLQALGIPLKRIPSTLIITVIGTLLTIISVAVYDFTTSVSLLLQLIVIASGPLITVFAADVILRRNKYDGRMLLADAPGSPFWYRNGWNWNGLASVSIGGVAALLCINTDVFVSPVSTLTGMDLSVPVGVIVSAGVYTLLFRRTTSVSPTVHPLPTSS